MSSLTQTGELESASSEATPVWMKRVPMITGVLAGLAGFLTVRAANMSNQAIYNSNQAVLHEAVASDKWTEYQADSIKRHIDENSLKTSKPDDQTRSFFEGEISDFRSRQERLAAQATAEEEQRKSELLNGKQKLAIKDLLDYAGVAAQAGIALASIAALTRARVWYHFGLAAGAIAIGVTGYALAAPYLMHLFKS